MNSRTTRCEVRKQNTPRQTRWSSSTAFVLFSTTRRERATECTLRLASLKRNGSLINAATRVDTGGKRIGFMFVQIWLGGFVFS
jgi:hypothetical protein